MSWRSGETAHMQKFRTWIDPRAAVNRELMRQKTPKDLCSGTLRLALHLSDLEHAQLELLNPETLGRHDDERLRADYWRQFIAAPESAPFRVNTV